MKKILTIFLLICSLTVSATTYYVRTGGSDIAAGTSDVSAWANITRVNAAWAAGTFNAGDSILFRRGDTWHGTIVTGESGTLGNPITVGVYGTGEKPIITGFTTLSSWTNLGNGIQWASVTCESSTNMVTVDGSQYWMGRYPNTGWMTIDSHAHSPETITDAALPPSPDLSSAEVVIRKNHWITDRLSITNHTSHTLTFTETDPMYPVYDGWGYFIQNDLSTLDIFGEWYYDTGTSRLYMYFGAETPSNHVVKVSALDKLVHSNGAHSDYITIDNISFSGANDIAIYGYPTPIYNTIQNCNISFSGKDAIWMHYPAYCSVTNTNISYSNNDAIYFSDTGTDNITSYNTITNTGTINGAGGSSDGQQIALLSVGANSIIEYNSIVNTGYIAIYYGGTNTRVNNNFIDSCSYLKDDGGGIYTYMDTNVGKQVLNNIVLNSLGASDGTGGASSQANGLYVDGYSSNILFDGNTVYNSTGRSIHMNPSSDITVTNNTFFQAPSFISIQRWPLSGFIENINISNNIFISTQNLSGLWDDKAILYVIDMNGEDLPFYGGSIITEVSHLGVIDNNYYHSNVPDAMSLYSTTPHQYHAVYTYDTWKSTFGHDVNSSITTGVTDESLYHFKYNASTGVTKYYTLSAPMVDAKNTNYSGTIALAPWTSIVLIGAGTVTLQTVISEGTEWGKDKNGNLSVDKNGRMMIIR